MQKQDVVNKENRVIERKLTNAQRLKELQASRNAPTTTAAPTTRITLRDKLLAGTALTANEEILRKEIIADRTAAKAKRAEMKAQKDKIKAILEKKQAGTTLTSDEQALLDSMPKKGGKG